MCPKRAQMSPKRKNIRKEGEMIEQLVTSKTRVKILKLFLSNIDKRYYLRELERMLDESLSPLRRQLIKLVRMGILNIEDEGNLKYYSLNKNFVGIGELQKLLVSYEIPEEDREPLEQVTMVGTKAGDAELAGARSATPKQFRYDLAVLATISIFVLITAIYVVQANKKNINQVAKLITENKPQAAISRSVNPASGEMISRKWKILPGNVPVLSSGETGEEKKSKEL